MRATIAAMVFTASFVARADELTPEAVANVRREQKAADEKIEKAHGNKPHSEMTPDERRQYMDEQRQARMEVLQKHGLDDKEYSRYEARLTKDERAQTKAEEDRLTAKAKKDEEDKKNAPKKEDTIPIQRGFGNGRPVEMEAKDGAPPVVEHGIPPEEQDGSTGADTSGAPPSRSHKGSNKKKSDDY
jgi:hypothetical protein